jgi:hypothetical protein
LHPFFPSYVVTNRAILSFCRPSYYHFREKNLTTNEFNKRLEIYCVPVRAGQSRILLRSSFQLKWFPQWGSHALSNRFLNTDTWLHDAERKIRCQENGHLVDVINSVYTSPTSSDIGVRAFRNWWKTYGMRNSPPHSFGPATREQLGPRSLTRREQIDPWIHHTKNCDVCRKALKSWKLVEKLSLVFSFTAAGFSVNGTRSFLAIFLSLAGLGVHYFSKSVCTIFEGNPYPSGVADRSVAAMKDD